MGSGDNSFLPQNGGQRRLHNPRGRLASTETYKQAIERDATHELRTTVAWTGMWNPAAV